MILYTRDGHPCEHGAASGAERVGTVGSLHAIWAPSALLTAALGTAGGRRRVVRKFTEKHEWVTTETVLEQWESAVLHRKLWEMMSSA